ncbi:zinc-binding alcohol dehydrogenase family protein [Pediococcus stilesii]|uniref:Zinc-type alcohol dehydrogenase-like protein n=2 Tax=Pediococcus stilesii TaxID=331679 RepID=A0A5R9BWX9_9LACO|nr:zinc-binding alcohol dehydrogenase family protein [Pediococcus stilesii]
MWAIGFQEHLPIDDKNSLFKFEMDMPVPEKHDLLIKVEAVSVNPVDIAVRKGTEKLTEPKVIGWDAVGTIIEKGRDVTLFNVGDRVFYAGSFKRPGSNSEYQLVDERIVGHAPQKLSDAEAAAMPLTSLTAWEALFEQLGIDPRNQRENSQKTILIINGAGGVGSIATQLAHWAGLNVIASASRPETIQWCLNHGADQTVNHRKNLVDEVRKLDHQNVDYILELNNVDAHWDEMVELIKPSGHICSITQNHQPVDLKAIKQKRATFAWEWMYTKSFYETPDMESQHEILEEIAQMLDNGELVSTLTRQFSPINVENLKKAHELVESGHMIGKVVITQNSSEGN